MHEQTIQVEEKVTNDLMVNGKFELDSLAKSFRVALDLRHVVDNIMRPAIGNLLSVMARAHSDDRRPRCNSGPYT